MMTTAQKTAPSPVYLNPDLKSPAAQEFEDKLTALIVGQDRAVRRITGLYQIFLAGLAHPGRPIGSPPGYLGHRETSPMLTQENLDRSHTEMTKLSLVLFDEIEKASDALWQL